MAALHNGVRLFLIQNSRFKIILCFYFLRIILGKIKEIPNSFLRLILAATR